MKPLAEIFTPDLASLDVRLGPLLFGKSEDAYERFELGEFHRALSMLACSENVPDHIRHNVELSKNLLLYSIYVFDFTTAAVHYAQIALESSLRRALGKKEDCRDNIDAMLKEASSRNLLSIKDHADIISTSFVSKSRNGIAHGKEGRNVFNQALAVPFVQMIFDAINAMFSISPSDLLTKDGQHSSSDGRTDNNGGTG